MLGRDVELLADAVADEHPHHPVAVGAGVGLDGPSDVGDGPARADGGDAQVAALAGHLDQGL